MGYLGEQHHHHRPNNVGGMSGVLIDLGLAKEVGNGRRTSMMGVHGDRGAP